MVWCLCSALQRCQVPKRSYSRCGCVCVFVCGMMMLCINQVMHHQDVWHNPTDEGKGRLWYGSPTVVDAWVGFLEEE